jgi:hypothetical protein
LEERVKVAERSLGASRGLGKADVHLLHSSF